MSQYAPPHVLDPSTPDPRIAAGGEVQEPPATLGQALRQIGPGLILAGAIVGTGELIATTNLGAKVGFALLWLVVLSCFVKVFVQIELGRYALSSGESTFTGFKRLPGPGALLVWWCLAMVLVTQMQIAAMVGGVGQAVHMALPGVSPAIGRALGASALLADRPALPWSVLTVIVTAAMLATGSYRVVERGTTFLVVMFTFMTIVCVGFLPAEHAVKGGDLLSGLAFHVPAGAAVAALTMFGITGVGASELLAYPYWCVEKGYARHVGPRDGSPEWAGRARGWMRVMRLDAWVSMAIYTLATLAFYLLGAAVLHSHTQGKGLPRTIGDMMNVLAHMYEPVMGRRAAIAFIVIGSFAVLYSTLFAATAGNSRLIADFLRVNGLIANTEESRRRWVRVFCLLLPFVAFGLFIGVRDPVLLVSIGGMMQAISLPLIGGAAVFLRYRRTDGRLAPGRVWDVFLWLSAVALTIAGTYSLWTTLSELGLLPK